MNELEALAALNHMPTLGPIKIRTLLHQFGSAVKAFLASAEEIEACAGFGPKISSIWKVCQQSNSWQKDLEQAARQGVQVVPFTHPQYPKRLLEIPDPPVLLYIKGELHPHDFHGIAVVGTRSPTLYGSEMAEKFGRELAAQGRTVVSGLARGIDTAAHRGALKTGRTLAVIGSGLGNIYPEENKELAQKIAKSGALISEFPMATPPDRQNLPQRNRIVSGMTAATLLIEAPLKSGAMITMEKAWEQKNRDLFAIPGRADTAQFGGNHWWIKTGRAQLVESIEDITNELHDFFGTPCRSSGHPPSPLVLEQDEAQLLGAFPEIEVGLEELEKITQWPVAKLNVLLMKLILKRAIKEFPGKLYKRAQ